MKYFNHIKLLVLLLSIQPQFAFSQSTQFILQTYTTDNGLVNNNVRSIARDGYGFLWIATWDGLSRFDGNEFRNYHHDPDDSTSLPYFELHKIVVDNYDNVWITSYFLSKYDRANDNFINYKLDCSNNQNFQELNAVCVIDPRNIWYLCGNGSVSKFNSENKTIVEYRHRNLMSNTGRFEVIKNRFFLIDWQIICEYFIDDKVDSLRFIREFKIPDSTLQWQQPPPNFYYSFRKILKINNDLYFQFPGSIFRFDEITGITEPFTPKDKDLNRFLNEDINWLPSKDGILIKPETDSMAILIPKSDAGYPQSCLYDKGGVFWIGGYTFQEQGYGLKAVIPVPSFFKHHLQNYDSGEKMAIFSCFKDHLGQVWIGAKNLNHLIKITQKGEIEQCNFISDAEVNISKQPRSFLELEDSVLFIGYFQKLFRKYDYSTGLFKPVTDTDFDDNRKTAFLSTKLLVKYNENHIIIGDEASICKYNFKTNHVEKMIDLSKLVAMSFHVDFDGTIWVGFHMGFLYHLDGDLQIIEKYRICISNLESICLGEAGVLWIASLGEGLFKFDTKTGTWSSFNSRDGLVNNVLYNVLKDKKGNLWMSSDHGISMFNPRVETFRNYGLSDGLLIDEFNADAAYLAPDGEMIFGGMGGIVRFYPDSITEIKTKNQPHLLITDLYVSGKPRHFEKAVYELENVELQQGDNNFKVIFSCLDLKNADKIRYRYLLEKVDKEWIITDHQNRSVSYAGLMPGNYKFILEATNPHGDWQYKTSLDIQVPAFFYQTLGFKMGIFFIVISMLIFFLMQWLRHERLKNRQMQQNLRLEALRGQLNPHFIYNSLNSINYFISKFDRENANQYIADFARLMRSILNNSTSDFIPLNKEIEAITDYLKLENMRFSDKFDFEIIINPKLEVDNLEVAPTMLQPFIENAIWHGVRYLEGRKGLIKIKFESFLGKYLICVVEDDGIGRNLSAERKSVEQKKRTSKGIKIITERLIIMNVMNKSNCQIKIEDLFRDKIETGTKVTIELPTRECI